MREYEIDREQAKARYVHKQLKQKIEALEEFDRRGELSDRQLLINAYKEEIQMVMHSDPDLAFARAVWLLGDCLDRIDVEHVELKQLAELYNRICEVAGVLIWHDDWRREFQALSDYMDRLKELMRHHGPEGKRWYHAQGFFDDPQLAAHSSGDMMSWLQMRYGEEEEAPSSRWGDADALREARKFYNSFVAMIG